MGARAGLGVVARNSFHCQKNVLNCMWIFEPTVKFRHISRQAKSATISYLNHLSKLVTHSIRLQFHDRLKQFAISCQPTQFLCAVFAQVSLRAHTNAWQQYQKSYPLMSGATLFNDAISPVGAV